MGSKISPIPLAMHGFPVRKNGTSAPRARANSANAPAEIGLSAEPGEVEVGGETVVTARVSDANGNPNSSVDVLYEIAVGTGELSSASFATDDEGIAAAVFTAGTIPGIVTDTLRNRVPSFVPKKTR